MMSHRSALGRTQIAVSPSGSPGRQLSDPCSRPLRRDVASGDSVVRVRRQDLSALEELAEVFVVLDAYNAVRHVQTGLTVGQVREIPRLAAREAIVNGIAHRGWGQSEPTVVEHIGRTLRVNSPGASLVESTKTTSSPIHPSRGIAPLPNSWQI